MSKHLAVKALQPQRLGIVSWNCDGLAPYLPGGGSVPLAEVAAHFGGPKVLCLQEIRVRAQDNSIVQAMESALPDAACHSSLCRDAQNVTFRGGRMYGVATWVRGLTVSNAYGFPWDREGRVIVTEIASHSIAIVNVYAVNGTDKPYYDHDLGRNEGDRHAFKRRWNARLFEECAALRKRTGGFDLVMIGDWNISRTKMDTYPRLRTEEPHSIARAQLNDELMPKLDVVDAFRELHPEATKYSWFHRRTPRSKLDAARVDYALVSSSLLPHIKAADIREAPEDRFLSDHAPLTLVIER